LQYKDQELRTSLEPASSGTGTSLPADD